MFYLIQRTLPLKFSTNSGYLVGLPLNVAEFTEGKSQVLNSSFSAPAIAKVGIRLLGMN